MTIPVQTTLKMSSKGQIAIPKNFREAIGLESGARLIIEYNEEADSLILKPFHHSIRELFGIAKIKNKKTTASDDDAIAQLIIQQDNRTKNGKQK